ARVLSSSSTTHTSGLINRSRPRSGILLPCHHGRLAYDRVSLAQTRSEPGILLRIVRNSVDARSLGLGRRPPGATRRLPRPSKIINLIFRVISCGINLSFE